MPTHKDLSDEFALVVAYKMVEPDVPTPWVMSDAEKVIALYHELVPEITVKSPTLLALIRAYRLGRENGR